MRRFSLFLCLVGFAVLVSSTSYAAKPKVIGVALPLTGEYAPLGIQIREAAELAAREHSIGLVVVDTLGTPAGAVEALTKLAANPNVIAVVGPLGQKTSDAGAAIANRMSIPLFVLSGSERANRGGSTVFRVHLSAEEQAASMAQVARKRLKGKRAAILFPETQFGRAAALSFGAAFEAAGGSVASVASYREDETDFRKPLDVLIGKKVKINPRERVGKRYKADRDGYARSRVKASRDFDVLFIPDYHTRVSRILAFLPGAGIQNGEGGEGVGVHLLGLSGWRGRSMELTGAKAAGAIIIDSFGGEEMGGRAEEFTRAFEGRTGRRPTSLEAETFDIVWLLGALARRTDSRAALMAALPRASAWEGVAGELRFGASGNPIRTQQLFRFDVDGILIPLD